MPEVGLRGRISWLLVLVGAEVSGGETLKQEIRGSHPRRAEKYEVTRRRGGRLLCFSSIFPSVWFDVLLLSFACMNFSIFKFPAWPKPTQICNLTTFLLSSLVISHDFPILSTDYDYTKIQILGFVYLTSCLFNKLSSPTHICFPLV